MHTPSSLTSAQSTDGSQSTDRSQSTGGSQVLSSRVPPANGGQTSSGRDAVGPTAVTRDPSEDHDDLAQRMNDVVVRRIFAAGLDLQGALLLIGEQQGTSKIHHAIDEMDQAIRDIRDILFDRSYRRPHAE
jgi:hypothetical protein